MCSSDSTWAMITPPRNTSSLKEWCRTSRCSKLDVHTGLCTRCLAPSVSSKTVIHIVPKPRKKNTPHVSHKHSLLDGVCQCYEFGFSDRRRMHFSIFKNQYTHAHAHITAPPETDPLSAAMLAWFGSAHATSPSPLPL